MDCVHCLRIKFVIIIFFVSVFLKIQHINYHTKKFTYSSSVIRTFYHV